jgi:frataxin-like iron-binding protein CyaY
MKKNDMYHRDVDECYDKICSILKEYRCEVAIDDELGGSIVIVDKDTSEYVIINN